MTGFITTAGNNIRIDYCPQTAHKVIVLTHLMDTCVVQSTDDNKLAGVEILRLW